MSKQLYRLSIQRRFFDAKLPSIVASSALAGMVAMNIVHNHTHNPTQNDSNSDSNSSEEDHENRHMNIIETDFLEKIASKSYLNYHNPFAHDSILTSAINTSKKVWNKVARSNTSPVSVNVSANDYLDKDNVLKIVSGSKQLLERPKGVPRRVRIMAIDVPEFREVFDGECRVNLSRVYPDGIAPSKFVKGTKRDDDDDGEEDGNEEEDGRDGNGDNNTDMDSNSNSNTNSDSDSEDTSNATPTNSENGTSHKTPTNTQRKRKHTNKNTKRKNTRKTNEPHDNEIEIIQKSLARSLVRCRNVQSKRIGVELLESSVYDLNPHNMRKTYQFGQYRYDPGKYGSMKKMPGDDMLQRRITAYGGPGSGVGRGKGYGYGRRRSSINTTNTTDDDRALGDVEDITEQDEKETTVIANDEDEADAPWNQFAWIEEMELRIHGRIPFGANVERTSWFTRKLFGRNFRSTVKTTALSPFLWFIPSFLIGSTPGGYDGIDGDYGKNKRTVNRASSKPHAVIADGSAMQRVPGSLRYLTKCCQEADVPLFIINDPRVWGGNTHRDLESAAKDMRKTIKARIVANALTIKEGSMFERGRVLGNLETETKWQIKDAGRRTRDAVRSAAARLQRERDENWSELSGEELLERLVDRQVLQKEGGSIKDSGSREAFGELCRLYLGDTTNSNQKVKVQQQQPNVVKSSEADEGTSDLGRKDNDPDQENSFEKQKV